MLSSWWIRLPASIIPAFYRSLSQALGRIRRRVSRRISRDGLVGPAGGQTSQTLPPSGLFWHAIHVTHQLTGEVEPLDLLRVMIDHFPEPRSSSAWRDVLRQWRAQEDHPLPGSILDQVIADLGNSNESDGLVPVVEALSRALRAFMA